MKTEAPLVPSVVIPAAFPTPKGSLISITQWWSLFLGWRRAPHAQPENGTDLGHHLAVTSDLQSDQSQTVWQTGTSPVSVDDDHIVGGIPLFGTLCETTSIF